MGASAESQKQTSQGQYLVTQNRLIFNAMTKRDQDYTAEMEDLLGNFLILVDSQNSKSRKWGPESCNQHSEKAQKVHSATP